MIREQKFVKGEISILWAEGFKMLKLSIVIPMYNEEEVLPKSIPLIIETIDFLQHSEYEVILVNDGSVDASLEIAIELKKSYQNIRVITMHSNHGHMKALEAGMREAQVEIVATMDCDLQDPPSALAEMYKQITATKVSCVQGVRIDRSKDSIWKKGSAHLYYKFIRTLTGVSVIHNAADYRMLTNDACKFLCSLPEKKKVFRLLIPYFGMTTIEYPIVRDHRVAGTSKYGMFKMIRLAIDSFLGFSTKPLRAILYTSMSAMLLGIWVGIFAIYDYVSGKTIPGWTSLTLLIIVLFSILLYSMAAIGEYVGRIYEEILDRPSIRYNEIF
jgi:dolichol-phosphate mannosyltransferase